MVTSAGVDILPSQIFTKDLLYIGQLAREKFQSLIV